MINVQADESLFSILKRLADEGYLQNTCRLDMRGTCQKIDSWIVELICLMKNLETLHLLDYELSPAVLAQVFQSCSKITRLHIMADNDEMPNMDECLKNQLRPDFQRLQYLHFECYIDEDSWLVLQEMLT